MQWLVFRDIHLNTFGPFGDGLSGRFLSFQIMMSAATPVTFASFSV